MSIDVQSSVGELATIHPQSLRVFSRHGIDFCCGGGKLLSEVCEEYGLEADAIAKEIEAAEARPNVDRTRWDIEPVADLIQHILDKFHKPLPDDINHIEMLAKKVERVHGHKTETLGRIRMLVVAMKEELLQHMNKEEQILFPAILSGQTGWVNGPISMMLYEHEQVGDVLAELRELTNDYKQPEGACNSWRGLWDSLERFELALHEHIHLENNVLFPRVT
jgi:regulator of cell morphogenesis and NO signaling